jgi:hypothetical protein
LGKKKKNISLVLPHHSIIPLFHYSFSFNSLCPLCPCGERFLFCARVRFIVNLHKLIHAHMGVALGGREAHVAQHFLDGPQVRPRIQQMGGEGMAKGMGTHLSQETAPQHVFLQDPRHAPGRQAGSPGVDE